MRLLENSDPTVKIRLTPIQLFYVQELLKKTEAAASEFRRLREQDKKYRHERESWEAERGVLERNLRDAKREGAQQTACAEKSAKAMAALFERETGRLLLQLEQSEGRRRTAEGRIMQLETQFSAGERRERERADAEAEKLCASKAEAASLRRSLEQALSALARCSQDCTLLAE
jgi:hypothetical protein